MEKTLSNPFVLTELSDAVAAHEKSAANIFTKFINWCDAQESNRFLWIAVTLFGLTGLIMPYTLLSVLFIGNRNFYLFLTVCVINVPVFAVNIAAQRTKVTLPAFFITLILDIAVMIYSLSFFLTH